MRKFLSWLFSIVLILNVFSFGRADAGARAKASLAQRAGAVRFVPRQIRESSRRLRFTIKARYPQAAGAVRDPRLAKLNQEIRQLAAREVTEFRKYFKEPPEQLGPMPSYYESEYWVAMARNDLVSLG